MTPSKSHSILIKTMEYVRAAYEELCSNTRKRELVCKNIPLIRWQPWRRACSGQNDAQRQRLSAITISIIIRGHPSPVPM
jgi:hypothetical protein